MVWKFYDVETLLCKVLTLLYDILTVLYDEET